MDGAGGAHFMFNKPLLWAFPRRTRWQMKPTALIFLGLSLTVKFHLFSTSKEHLFFIILTSLKVNQNKQKF